MKSFAQTQALFEESGRVEQISGSVAFVSGLPGARVGEVVISESETLGYVVSIGRSNLEVIHLLGSGFEVGHQVVREGERVKVFTHDGLLGQHVNALGLIGTDGGGVGEPREVEERPLGLERRRRIDRSFSTGVSIVDLVIPLGSGQRELVIGDRKSGKSEFLRQVALSHVRGGGVCVYAAIAKRQSELSELLQYFAANNGMSRVVVVSSAATDPSGLVMITPFTAMTISEFFRDQGREVLIVLDDLTVHARYYREMSLLSKRFPGRSSYPADIFHIHARLLERAGNFDRGSITCLPVAETVFGDLTGYIQTNLMSMTDGHIYFDHEYFNQGRRPAINPFLSVTRVGRQTQGMLLQQLGRELTSFWVGYEKVKQLTHFGGEINQQANRILELGEKIQILFDQEVDVLIPSAISAVMLGALWAGLSDGEEKRVVSDKLRGLRIKYQKDSEYRGFVDGLFVGSGNFAEFISKIKSTRGELWRSDYE